MRTAFPRRLLLGVCVGLVFLVLVAIVGTATVDHWLPRFRALVAPASPACDHAEHGESEPPCTEHDAHANEVNSAHNHAETTDPHEHEAEHADHESASKRAVPFSPTRKLGQPLKSASDNHRHDEAATVKLSTAAQKNVGITTAQVELGAFVRTMTVPAMVVPRPGRSHIQVAAPLTGAVTRIYPMQGEAIMPGQPLFDLRLTHEEVVEAQAMFLQTAEELDVVRREIDRLEKVVASGAVAGKTLLERKYEQQKLEAALRSQRQRLLLHGLSPDQADVILKKRALLSEMTIFAPKQREELPDDDSPPLLQVEELKVDKGQHVRAGELLCVLADYSELYIQGKAFEQDVPILDNAANQDWRVTAVFTLPNRQQRRTPDLEIFSLANTVELESRAFLFHVLLPNKLIRDHKTPKGRRFCTWQFKPGQRLELLVPIERWADRLVLPRDAVVQDGAESYVFEKIGGHFDRRAVRVEYRDQHSVVLANDGTLTPGATVVTAGAYQIHLALKNKAGGAPDPHAGHNH